MQNHHPCAQPAAAGGSNAAIATNFLCDHSKIISPVFCYSYFWKRRCPLSHRDIIRQEFKWKWNFWGLDSEIDKRLTSALILLPLEGKVRTTYTLCVTAVNGRQTMIHIARADFSCSYFVWVKLISFFLLINEDSLWLLRLHCFCWIIPQLRIDGERHQFVSLVCSIPLPEELTP